MRRRGAESMGWREREGEDERHGVYFWDLAQISEGVWSIRTGTHEEHRQVTPCVMQRVVVQQQGRQLEPDHGDTPMERD